MLRVLVAGLSHFSPCLRLLARMDRAPLRGAILFRQYACLNCQQRWSDEDITTSYQSSIDTADILPSTDSHS
jgi:hypothetical protein